MWQFIVQMIAQKKAQNQAFVADAQKAASAQQTGEVPDPPSKQGQLAGAKDNVSGALGSMMGGSSPGGSSQFGAGDVGADAGGAEIGGAEIGAAQQLPQKIDVFGGEQFGQAAETSGAKASQNPAVADYLKNAMASYARNKVGKKIGAKLDMAADVANAFGDENKTETGGKIQDVADWFAGTEQEKRERAKRERGLYAY